jgi:hypothetical protein
LSRRDKILNKKIITDYSPQYPQEHTINSTPSPHYSITPPFHSVYLRILRDSVVKNEFPLTAHPQNLLQPFLYPLMMRPGPVKLIAYFASVIFTNIFKGFIGYPVFNFLRGYSFKSTTAPRAPVEPQYSRYIEMLYDKTQLHLPVLPRHDEIRHTKTLESCFPSIRCSYKNITPVRNNIRLSYRSFDDPDITPRKSEPARGLEEILFEQEFHKEKCRLTAITTEARRTQRIME